MRSICRFLVALGLASSFISPAIAAPQDVANDIAREMMSPYCEGVTLHDCPSDASRQLRTRIAGWAESGMTKDAIWSRLEDEFGTDIRATPGADGAGLWAWVIPILATLGAGALAVVLARRWVGRKPKEEPRSTEISPEQRRRLDVELAALRDQRG